MKLTQRQITSGIATAIGAAVIYYSLPKPAYPIPTNAHKGDLLGNDKSTYYVNLPTPIQCGSWCVPVNTSPTPTNYIGLTLGALIAISGLYYMWHNKPMASLKLV